MPPPKITIKLSDGTSGVIDADPELIRNALAEDKGATFGNVPIRRGDEVGTVSGDLLENAVSDGWKVDAGLTEGLPDIPLAGEQGPVTLESVDQAAYQRSEQGLRDAKFRRGLDAQLEAERQREQLQLNEGAGLTTARGLSNLAQTAGEQLSRGVSVGFDAPMAAVQATTEAMAGPPIDQEGVEMTPHRGVTPGGEQPAVSWADRFDSAMQGIEGRREANPVTGAVSEVAGAVVPALATGGQGVLARLAAQAPTGRLAALATKWGVGAGSGILRAAKVAQQGPGMATGLARLAAPAIALGIEGGVQGGVSSATQAANTLWQSEDDNSVADYLLAMGESGLKGGALGFGLGGLIGLGKGIAGARKGIEGSNKTLRGMRLMSEEAPTLPPTMAPADLAEHYPVPEGPGAGTALARKAVKLTPDAAKGLRDKLYNEVQADADEFFQLRGQLDNDLDLKAKKAYVAKHGTTQLSSQYNPATVRETAGLLSPQELDTLIADPAIAQDGKGTAALLRRLQIQLKASVDDLFKISEERPLTEGDLFWTLDQMKRDTDKVVSRTNNGNQHVFEILKPRADALREALMDEEAWTVALPKMQRATNESWARSIAATNDTLVKPILHFEGEQAAWNAFDQPPKVNGEWLYSHMGAAGVHPPEAQMEKAFNRLLNAHADDAITRAQIYGSDEMLKVAKRAVELRGRLQTKLGQAVDINKNVGAGTDVARHLGAAALVPGATYAAEVAGDRMRSALYGGTVKGVEQVQRAAELSRLVLGARPSAALAIGSRAAEPAVKAAANPEEIYQYVQRLVSGDPANEDAFQMLDQAVGPALGAAARAHLERQRDFIMEKVGDPKDPQARQRMLDYGSAALRPMDALNRIGAGVGTPADRETVQKLYPALWKRFVESALQNMEKKGATYDDKIRASQALGMTLDPSLEPARVEQLQGLVNSKAGANPSGEAGEPTLSPSARRAPNTARLHGGKP